MPSDGSPLSALAPSGTRWAHRFCGTFHQHSRQWYKLMVEFAGRSDRGEGQMPGPNSNAIIAQYASAEQLLAAPDREVERVLLCHIVEYCANGMHPMATRDSISNGLFDANGYTYSIQAKSDVQRVIGRAWKALEDAGFIEEPDPDNGRNGFRVPSAKGRSAHASTDYIGLFMRSKFSRDMFPALPDAAWNAFTVGDYDTAIFEAFKSLEVAVRTKGGFTSVDFGGPYEEGIRPGQWAPAR
jgi:hypothetical protein